MGKVTRLRLWMVPVSGSFPRQTAHLRCVRSRGWKGHHLGFRGEEGASAPHTLTCMSSRTLGFRPELDRLPTICRALTGFLGAYSRLPGPPGSGLAPGVKVASGNQPSPWRRLSRGSLPRTRCPGGSSVWEVFPVGSRPPASLGRAAMRKLPRGSGAAEFSGSSTNDLLGTTARIHMATSSWGRGEKRRPIRIRVHHERLRNSRFCLSRCGAHSRRSAPAKRRWARSATRIASTKPSMRPGVKQSSHRSPITRTWASSRSIRGSIRPTRRSRRRIGST